MRLAAEGGFDINGLNSGIMLTTEEHKFTDTYGNHNAYNDAVLEELAQIDLNQTPAEIAAEIQALANRLRGEM